MAVATFVQVTTHQAGHSSRDLCFANAGTISLPGNSWITRVSTGNNRVQWFGDARWQPDAGINKWTVHLAEPLRWGQRELDQDPLIPEPPVIPGR